MTTDQQHSEFEELRKSLIALRVQVGADTPLGRRYSAAIEILGNILTAESDDQRASLKVSLARVTREIRRLQRDGGKFVYENHAVLSRIPTNPSQVPYQQGVTIENERAEARANQGAGR
jgi:hypothetical protein